MSEDKQNKSLFFEIGKLLLGLLGLQLLAIVFIFGLPVYFFLKMIGTEDSDASQIGVVCGAGREYSKFCVNACLDFHYTIESTLEVNRQLRNRFPPIGDRHCPAG